MTRQRTCLGEEGKPHRPVHVRKTYECGATTKTFHAIACRDCGCRLPDDTVVPVRTKAKR